MKKISLMILSAILILSLLCGCGSSEPSPDPSEQDIDYTSLLPELEALAADASYARADLEALKDPESDEPARSDSQRAAEVMLGGMLNNLSEKSDSRSFTVKEYHNLTLSVADAGSESEYVYGTVELSYDGKLEGVDFSAGEYGTVSIGEWHVTETDGTFTLTRRSKPEDTKGQVIEERAQEFVRLKQTLTFRDETGELGTDEIVRDMILELMAHLSVPDDDRRTFTVLECRAFAPVIMESGDPERPELPEDMPEGSLYVTGTADIRFDGELIVYGVPFESGGEDFVTVSIGGWWIHGDGTDYTMEPYVERDATR